MTPRVIPTATSVNPGMRVRYSADMAGRQIDRNAWASVVHDAIQRLDRGNKSAFARRVGLTTRTIDRWLGAAVDVSENSVRQIAEHTGQNPIDLLVTVGYYRPNELAGAAPAAVDPRKDPVIQLILADPTWTEEEKIVLVQRELDRIERERQQRLADYEWYLRQRNAAS